MKKPHLWFLALTLIGCGCFQTTSQHVIQNKFAFPNSDLAPLGVVSAETSNFRLLAPKALDKAEYDELSRDALHQKGGDTLVDYVVENDNFFPILPIVWYQTFKINGPAVKVTQIGASNCINWYKSN